MPDLVFACVYLFLGGLIVWLCQQNCIQKRSGNFRLIEKYVADRFQPSLSRLSRRATLPLCRQRSGFVQSRSLERSHSVQKFDCVQVQTAALSIKSHGKSRKCMWKHHWNKMKLDFGMFAYLHTLIHIALKTQKWFAWKTTEVHLIVCACNQVRPFEPTCFPCVEFTSRPTVAGIGLGAEKLEGAHSFFSTAWGTSI